MKRNRGSNQYRDKWGFYEDTEQSVLVMVIFMLLVFIASREWVHAHPIVSPCQDSRCNVVYAAEARPKTLDEMVDFYATRYSKNVSQKSWMKAMLHFLLYKESKHGEDKQQGDGGLAGGPMQFHEATYLEYRKIMKARGLTDHIGSRFDLEDAIETAAWAIFDGRGNAWGPIARKEIKL